MTTMSASPETAPSEDAARRWADNYHHDLLRKLEAEQLRRTSPVQRAE